MKVSLKSISIIIISILFIIAVTGLPEANRFMNASVGTYNKVYHGYWAIAVPLGGLLYCIIATVLAVGAFIIILRLIIGE